MPEQPRVLWLGGDVHFGERGGAALEDLRLDGPLVVNLEGPISKQPRPSSAQALFNPPDAAARLKAANVIAAGIDNNHALDGDGERAREPEDVHKHERSTFFEEEDQRVLEGPFGCVRWFSGQHQIENLVNHHAGGHGSVDFLSTRR